MLDSYSIYASSMHRWTRVPAAAAAEEEEMTLYLRLSEEIRWVAPTPEGLVQLFSHPPTSVTIIEEFRVPLSDLLSQSPEAENRIMERIAPQIACGSDGRHIARSVLATGRREAGDVSRASRGERLTVVVGVLLKAIWVVGSGEDAERQGQWKDVYVGSPVEVLEKVEKVGGDGPSCCAICIDELGEGVEMRKMPCGHVFHRECIGKWLRRANSCPMCRFQLPSGLQLRNSC